MLFLIPEFQRSGLKKAMKINDETVKKIGRLARLEIKENEIPAVAAKLESILNWIEQLDEVNTDNVEPLFSVHLDHMPMREDVVTDGGYPDKILKNAPESGLNMFMVPKVVE